MNITSNYNITLPRTHYVGEGGEHDSWKAVWRWKSKGYCEIK